MPGDGTVLDTFFLYIVRCADGSYYVGSTSDPVARLEAHNAGRSPHTSKFTPWEQVMAIEFSDTRKANTFERYLKPGSGRAFANRHFW